jgi:hypothetical protein
MHLNVNVTDVISMLENFMLENQFVHLENEVSSVYIL